MVMKFRFINVRAGISLLENEMETGVVKELRLKKVI